jgi:hypothetical protein
MARKPQGGVVTVETTHLITASVKDKDQKHWEINVRLKDKIIAETIAYFVRQQVGVTLCTYSQIDKSKPIITFQLHVKDSSIRGCTVFREGLIKLYDQITVIHGEFARELASNDIPLPVRPSLIP